MARAFPVGAIRAIRGAHRRGPRRRRATRRSLARVPHRRGRPRPLARRSSSRRARDASGRRIREDDALRAQLTSQQLRLESRMQRQDADDAGTLALRRVDRGNARADRRQPAAPVVAWRRTQATLPESIAEVQRQLPARHRGARVFRRRRQHACVAADQPRAAAHRAPGPRAVAACDRRRRRPARRGARPAAPRIATSDRCC